MRWFSIALLVLAACGTESPSPPRLQLQRLNRLEYDRTVADLLGTRLEPARDFPIDDSANGFDNQRAVLALSPVQLELYRQAAEVLVSERLHFVPVERIEAETLEGPDGAAFHGYAWALGDGALVVPIHPTRAGEYRVTIKVAPIGRGIGTLELEGTAAAIDRPRWINFRFAVSSTTGIALDLAARGDPLAVDWLRIDGPLEATSAELGCRVEDGDPGFHDCAMTILGPFLRRAYRRSIREDEIARWVSVAEGAFDDGEGFDRAIGLSLQGILVSPHFLFRAEPVATGPGQRLGDEALANRLSYFLWSSMPDDRLLTLAAAGRLADDAVLVAEAERMLADPRADALLDGFFAQWLGIRALAEITPDPAAYPSFDEALRVSAKDELVAFARALLDAPIEDLLLGESAAIDARLAEHYGLLPGALLPDDRRGLLGKAGFLMITSHSNRSSPTRRGRFVLDRLLCIPPPPPPPNVTELSASDDVGTLRERLEAHRQKPACAGCHTAMDPIGFGLEGFDGIGAARTEDQGAPIDDSGVLFGEPFAGPRALSLILSERPELRPCVAEKLATYALGHSPADRPVLEGRTFRDLILSLVGSRAFTSAPEEER